MTAQSTCHSANEIVASLPIDLTSTFDQEQHNIVKVSKTIFDKTPRPRYSASTISWEYFQNELEFE